MKKLTSYIVSFLLFLLFALTRVFAGPIPATALQYPVFYYTSSGLVTNTGTAETNLFQVYVPGQALGNNGYIRVTLYEYSPDAAAANHLYKVYLGGTGNPVANGTCVATNTVTTSLENPALITIFANGALNAQRVFQQTSTNWWTLATPQANTFNTGTNFNLTVTGSGAFSTNVFGLDGAIIEVGYQP